MKFCCYNADTSCNTLRFKGLPVTRARLSRIARLICLLTAVASFGFPLEARAASTRKSASPAATGNKVTLKKRTYSARASRLRRARVARARAAVRAQEMREAQVPRFKLDETGALVPDLRAEAAIVYNPENGQVLWESNSTAKG